MVKAYAEAETDEYGNLIDWEPGAGNEDNAGNDIIEDYGQWDELRTQQAEDIQESISELLNEGIQPTNTEIIKTGTVTCKFLYPEHWIGNDVILYVYHRVSMRKYDIHVGSGTNYETTEELPLGHYEVHSAYVDGDEVNAYNPLFDVYDFELLEDSNVFITITLSLPGVISGVEEASSSFGESTTKTENSASQEDSQVIKNAHPVSTFRMVLIGLCLSIGSILLFLLLKSSKRKER